MSAFATTGIHPYRRGPVLDILQKAIPKPIALIKQNPGPTSYRFSTDTRSPRIASVSSPTNLKDVSTLKGVSTSSDNILDLRRLYDKLKMHLKRMRPGRVAYQKKKGPRKDQKYGLLVVDEDIFKKQFFLSI
ncbi:hypothetical protein HOY82DRAFT_600459 [Tuber indicum]|nr:hypothetical protein HOY82DRAFT_600459 [Tuber indicum]